MTQKQIRDYLSSHIDKATRKRLHLQIISDVANKTGSFVAIHRPMFINVDVDQKFEVLENYLTYCFRNSKIAVTIWKDKSVSPHITIF